MTSVKIPLDPAIVIGSKRYEYVKVRPPSYNDFMEIGEVLQTQMQDGVRMAIEHLDRMKAYADRLVSTGDDTEADPAVLAAGGFRLARKVQAQVLDFLYLSQDEAGTTSQTSSSSGSSGEPTS